MEAATKGVVRHLKSPWVPLNPGLEELTTRCEIKLLLLRGLGFRV
jgi:hypothetical protein